MQGTISTQECFPLIKSGLVTLVSLLPQMTRGKFIVFQNHRQGELCQLHQGMILFELRLIPKVGQLDFRVDERCQLVYRLIDFALV